MIYSLFLYKYQVQNTANAAPRCVYDTSAAPSTHRANAHCTRMIRVQSRRLANSAA